MTQRQIIVQKIAKVMRLFANRTEFANHPEFNHLNFGQCPELCNTCSISFPGTKCYLCTGLDIRTHIRCSWDGFFAGCAEIIPVELGKICAVCASHILAQQEAARKEAYNETSGYCPICDEYTCGGTEHDYCV